MRLQDEDVERFWKKVDRREEDGGCWLWSGYVAETGYGTFSVRGVPVGAHRVSWEIENGREIPRGLVVRHRCDVRACVRPDHLELGTRADNHRDTLARGRWRYAPLGSRAEKSAGPRRLPGPTRLPQAIRFWPKVQRGSSDECWPWLGGLDRRGYGKFHAGGRHGRRLKAHRVAYELAVGPIPEGLHILHSCDNPPCCNPSHLRAGSNADNVRDCIERGREADRRGERNGRAKLREDQVREIKRRLAAGETQAALGAEFGVGQAQVSNIARGRQWAQVEA